MAARLSNAIKFRLQYFLITFLGAVNIQVLSALTENSIASPCQADLVGKGLVASILMLTKPYWS